MKISEILYENFLFLVVKFSAYWNVCFFVVFFFCFFFCFLFFVFLPFYGKVRFAALYICMGNMLKNHFFHFLLKTDG